VEARAERMQEQVRKLLGTRSSPHAEDDGNAEEMMSRARSINVAASHVVHYRPPSDDGRDDEMGPPVTAVRSDTFVRQMSEGGVLGPGVRRTNSAGQNLPVRDGPARVQPQPPVATAGATKSPHPQQGFRPIAAPGTRSPPRAAVTGPSIRQ
jgi:hypothetical protein